MRALFLDIDGVIVTPSCLKRNAEQRREPEEFVYDTRSLAYVGQLVARTGARVVLTSSWRADLDTKDPLLAAIVQNLLNQLKRVGAPMSDVTPMLPGGDRSAEIGAWLDEHPCESYVIIDDRARFEERPEVARGHLVLIEDSDGIRHEHFRRALDIL